MTKPHRVEYDRGEYRPVYTVILDSEEFKVLSKDAKLLWWGLKMSLGPAGIGILFDDALAERSGITRDELDPARRELVDGRWLEMEGRTHWLRNGLRFEPTINLTNENHRKYVIRVLQGLPKLAIIARFAAYYELPNPFGSPGSGTNGKHPLKPAGPMGAEGQPEGIGDGIPKASGITPHPTTTTTPPEPDPNRHAHARATAAAVGSLCERIDVAWKLDVGIADWAAALAAEAKYAGIDLPYEIEKCTEYHLGSPKKLKAPHLAIRNWLETAKKIAERDESRPRKGRPDSKGAPDPNEWAEKLELGKAG